MSKRKPKAAEPATATMVERLYASMFSQMLTLCPPNLSVAVILIHHEQTSPLLLGSCCAKCAAAMVHMTAEVIEDPREEDAAPDATHQRFH